MANPCKVKVGSEYVSVDILANDFDSYVTEVTTQRASIPKHLESAVSQASKMLNMDYHDIRIVTGLIDGNALGAFTEKGEILLSEDAQERTVYHEAFEAVWGNYFDDIDKQLMLRELRKDLSFRASPLYQELSNLYPEHDATDLDKEYLAEMFADYVEDVEEQEDNIISSIFSRLKSFIRKVNNLLTSGKWKDYSTSEAFKSIKEGAYKNAIKVTDIRSRAYSRKVEIGEYTLNPTQTSDLMSYFEIETMKELFDDPTKLMNWEAKDVLESNPEETVYRLLGYMQALQSNPSVLPDYVLIAEHIYNIEDDFEVIYQAFKPIYTAYVDHMNTLGLISASGEEVTSRLDEEMAANQLLSRTEEYGLEESVYTNDFSKMAMSTKILLSGIPIQENEYTTDGQLIVRYKTSYSTGLPLTYSSSTLANYVKGKTAGAFENRFWQILGKERLGSHPVFKVLLDRLQITDVSEPYTLDDNLTIEQKFALLQAREKLQIDMTKNKTNARTYVQEGEKSSLRAGDSHKLDFLSKHIRKLTRSAEMLDKNGNTNALDVLGALPMQLEYSNTHRRLALRLLKRYSGRDIIPLQESDLDSFINIIRNISRSKGSETWTSLSGSSNLHIHSLAEWFENVMGITSHSVKGPDGKRIYRITLNDSFTIKLNAINQALQMRKEGYTKEQVYEYLDRIVPELTANVYTSYKTGIPSLLEYILDNPDTLKAISPSINLGMQMEGYTADTKNLPESLRIVQQLVNAYEGITEFNQDADRTKRSMTEIENLNNTFSILTTLGNVENPYMQNFMKVIKDKKSVYISKLGNDALEQKVITDYLKNQFILQLANLIKHNKNIDADPSIEDIAFMSNHRLDKINGKYKFQKTRTDKDGNTIYEDLAIPYYFALDSNKVSKKVEEILNDNELTNIEDIVKALKNLDLDSSVKNVMSYIVNDAEKVFKTLSLDVNAFDKIYRPSAAYSSRDNVKTINPFNYMSLNANINDGRAVQKRNFLKGFVFLATMQEHLMREEMNKLMLGDLYAFKSNSDLLKRVATLTSTKNTSVTGNEWSVAKRALTREYLGDVELATGLNAYLDEELDSRDEAVFTVYGDDIIASEETEDVFPNMEAGDEVSKTKLRIENNTPIFEFKSKNNDTWREYTPSPMRKIVAEDLIYRRQLKESMQTNTAHRKIKSRAGSIFTKYKSYSQLIKELRLDAGERFDTVTVNKKLFIDTPTPSIFDMKAIKNKHYGSIVSSDVDNKRTSLVFSTELNADEKAILAEADKYITDKIKEEAEYSNVNVYTKLAATIAKERTQGIGADFAARKAAADAAMRVMASRKNRVTPEQQKEQQQLFKDWLEGVDKTLGNYKNLIHSLSYKGKSNEEIKDIKLSEIEPERRQWILDNMPTKKDQLVGYSSSANVIVEQVFKNSQDTNIRIVGTQSAVRINKLDDFKTRNEIPDKIEYKTKADKKKVEKYIKELNENTDEKLVIDEVKLKRSGKTILVLSFQSEVQTSTKEAEQEYLTLLEEEIESRIAPYQEVESTDAAGIATLTGMRSMMERNADWGLKQQKQFEKKFIQMEILKAALEVDGDINEATFTVTQNGEQKTYTFAELLIDDVLNLKDTLDESFKGFRVRKIQGAGFATDIAKAFQSKEDVGVIPFDIIKTAVHTPDPADLFYLSLDGKIHLRRGMIEKVKELDNNNIPFYFARTAKKGYYKGDKGTNKPRTITDKGLNEDRQGEVTKHTFSWHRVGDQLKLKDKVSSEGTSGSQQAKVKFSGMFNQGVPIDYGKPDWHNMSESEKLSTSEIYKSYKEQQAAFKHAFMKNFRKTFADLGVIIGDYNPTLRGKVIGINNEYSVILPDNTAARAKFFNRIKQKAIASGEDLNTVRYLDELANHSEAKIDNHPSRRKLQQTLFSMIQSQIRARKVPQISAPLIPETLYEGQKRLRMYKKVGDYIRPAQAYTTIPTKLYDWSIETFGSFHKFNAFIEGFNDIWYEVGDANPNLKNSEIINSPEFQRKYKKLLDTKVLIQARENQSKFTPEAILGIIHTKGYRIPTQSMASIDNLLIKGFLSPSTGGVVMTYKEIVAKAGSDYDVDKMNLHLRDYKINNKGVLEITGTLNPSKYKGLHKAAQYLFDSFSPNAVQKTIELFGGSNTSTFATGKYRNFSNPKKANKNIYSKMVYTMYAYLNSPTVKELFGNASPMRIYNDYLYDALANDDYSFEVSGEFTLDIDSLMYAFDSFQDIEEGLQENIEITEAIGNIANSSAVTENINKALLEYVPIKNGLVESLPKSTETKAIQVVKVLEMMLLEANEKSSSVSTNYNFGIISSFPLNGNHLDWTSLFNEQYANNDVIDTIVEFADTITNHESLQPVGKGINDELDLELDYLGNKHIYLNMLRPIGDYGIKNARSLVMQYGEEFIAKLSSMDHPGDMFSMSKNLEWFNTFIEGKALVGAAALATMFSAAMQLAQSNIQLSGSSTTLSVGNSLDQNFMEVMDFYSDLVSIAVDNAHEPVAKTINYIFATANVTSTLAMLGMPKEQIIAVITDPVVRRYTELLELEKSVGLEGAVKPFIIDKLQAEGFPLTSYNVIAMEYSGLQLSRSKGHKYAINENIVDELSRLSTWVKNIKKVDVSSLDEELLIISQTTRRSTNVDLERSSENKHKIIKTWIKELENRKLYRNEMNIMNIEEKLQLIGENAMSAADTIDMFMALEQVSRQLSKNMAAVNNDTKGIGDSFFTLNRRVKNNKVVYGGGKAPIFSATNIQGLRESNHAMYADSLTITKTALSKLDIGMSEDITEQLQELADSLLAFKGEATASSIWERIVDHLMAYSILESSPEIKVEYENIIDSIQTSVREGSRKVSYVEDLLTELNERFPENWAVSNLTLGSSLGEYSRFVQIPKLEVFNIPQTTEEKNTMITYFDQLLDAPEGKKLLNKLVALAIFQNGLSQGDFSFSRYIPQEIYSSVANIEQVLNSKDKIETFIDNVLANKMFQAHLTLAEDIEVRDHVTRGSMLVGEALSPNALKLKYKKIKLKHIADEEVGISLAGVSSYIPTGEKYIPVKLTGIVIDLDESTVDRMYKAYKDVLEEYNNNLPETVDVIDSIDKQTFAYNLARFDFKSVFKQSSPLLKTPDIEYLSNRLIAEAPVGNLIKAKYSPMAKFTPASNVLLGSDLSFEYVLNKTC